VCTVDEGPRSHHPYTGSVTRFWHPVSDMHAVVEKGELLLERGVGSHVWDTEGRRYLDATAGLWYANVGYGREEIAAAAAEQMRRLHAYSHYGDVSSPPTTALAARIAAVAPMDDAVVFFASGGGESIETAAKMCRRYWSLVGRDEKTVIVTRERCYHGLAGYGTSIVGSDVFKTGVGPLVGDTVRVAWESADALADAIDEIGAERVAAFFCEPIIGAGGVLLPPDGYLSGVQRICRERDVLFLVDEVICGFGRVGDWFASRRLGLEPDLLTFAKGVTSGYVPLGGVVVGPRVRDAFWAEGAGVWRHGYTYSGHATAAAAAHPNLDIMEREGLFARALELEREITEALEPLAGHDLVTEVRSGLGAVAAVQIDPALTADDPGLPDRANAAAREHGVLTRTLVGGGLQVSPPLVITRAELVELAEGFAAALDAVSARV
jgi:putrescine---pyruvate transaminase